MSRLCHLHQEGGLTLRQIVRGSNPAKNLVHQPNSGAIGRYKGAYLSQQRNESSLPKVGALSRHVWPSNEGKILFLGKESIIGNKFPRGKVCLHHGMAASPDFRGSLIRHIRLHPLVVQRRLSQSRNAVAIGHLSGQLEKVAGMFLNFLPHLKKELPLQLNNAALGGIQLLLQLLQPDRSIAVAVHHGAAKYKMLRHTVQLCQGNLNVVARDAIVAHLQTRNPSNLPLLLHVGVQDAVEVVPHLQEMVQFRRPAPLHEPTLRQNNGCVIGDAEANHLHQLLSLLRVCSAKMMLVQQFVNLNPGSKACPQRQYILSMGTIHSHTACQTLHIKDGPQPLPHLP